MQAKAGGGANVTFQEEEGRIYDLPTTLNARKTTLQNHRETGSVRAIKVRTYWNKHVADDVIVSNRSKWTNKDITAHEQLFWKPEQGIYLIYVKIWCGSNVYLKDFKENSSESSENGRETRKRKVEVSDDDDRSSFRLG